MHVIITEQGSTTNSTDTSTIGLSTSPYFPSPLLILAISLSFVRLPPLRPVKLPLRLTASLVAIFSRSISSITLFITSSDKWASKDLMLKLRCISSKSYRKIMKPASILRFVASSLVHVATSFWSTTLVSRLLTTSSKLDARRLAAVSWCLVSLSLYSNYPSLAFEAYSSFSMRNIASLSWAFDVCSSSSLLKVASLANWREPSRKATFSLATSSFSYWPSKFWSDASVWWALCQVRQVIAKGTRIKWNPNK